MKGQSKTAGCSHKAGRVSPQLRAILKTTDGGAPGSPRAACRVRSMRCSSIGRIQILSTRRHDLPARSTPGSSPRKLVDAYPGLPSIVTANVHAESFWNGTWSGLRLTTVFWLNDPVPVTPDLIQMPWVAGRSMRLFETVTFSKV